ncbi:hypothetical protein K6U55_08580 [Vibrio diabolicus]|uniref:hypothetical protein n=2 Tax=Vibrio diabolicus TaxID=50719 RepID=UPI00211B4CDA|nr:hypothetical protein [Vibrio diabolicus]MCG6242088.1 hypothetical protein [Vibrio diabolicus]
MKETKLLLALRKKNGQIGYLSEGVTIPEFFDLVTPNSNNIVVLPDFSPVINTLYSIHKKYGDEELTRKYSSLINYWADASTYSIKDIKLQKNVQLASFANEILNSIQLRVNEKIPSFVKQINEIDNVVREITPECNMYIDTLLCFIHSKASLEIESFKRDCLLVQYCDFLYDKVLRLYNLATNNSDSSTRFNESLLCYLSFNKPEVLNEFLILHPEHSSSEDIKQKYISQCQPEEVYDENYGYVQQFGIRYRYYDDREINTCKSIKAILTKIISVKELLKKLRDEDVVWDDSTDLMNELQEFINQPIQKQHCLSVM